MLSDPAVSRLHARIAPGNGGGPVLEDAGSAYGTYVDGVRVTGPVPLHDGATDPARRLRAGGRAAARDDHRAGARDRRAAGRASTRRSSGCARACARATRSSGSTRRGRAAAGSSAISSATRSCELSDDDVELFQQLDGSRSLADLIALAEQRFGATGRARLARLLADLGDRGFLAGVAAAAEAPEARPAAPAAPAREVVRRRSARAVDGVYRRGGWVLFTRPALIALGVARRRGRRRVRLPRRRALRHAVRGRAARSGSAASCSWSAASRSCACTKLAHGLAMASFGRRVGRAGVKLVLIFPYAFVDTSEAWFEPRRRRIAVSAAGPVSDFSLGALFAICCLVLAPGTVRDIFFQLAFAAYVGACFNLNPFLERDGYHILVDLLREPSLRRRAREQFARRLSGGGAAEDSPVLARYSLFALAWSVLAALFAIAMTFRYKPTLEELAPAEWIVWLAMGIVWVAVFVPVIVVLARPLAQRLRPEG